MIKACYITSYFVILLRIVINLILESTIYFIQYNLNVIIKQYTKPIYIYINFHDVPIYLFFVGKNNPILFVAQYIYSSLKMYFDNFVI